MADGKLEASAQETRTRESFPDTSPWPASHGTVTPPQSLCHCDMFYNLRAQYAFSLRSHVSVSRAHLPGLVVVLYLPQVPAAGLRNPLPRHQVPHHHRGGADFCNDTVTRVCEESSASPRNATSCLGEEFALGEPFRTRLCRHLIRTGCRGHRMTRTANTHKAQSRARKARAHRTPMLWPDSPGGAAEVPRGAETNADLSRTRGAADGGWPWTGTRLPGLRVPCWRPAEGGRRRACSLGTAGSPGECRREGTGQPHACPCLVAYKAVSVRPTETREHQPGGGRLLLGAPVSPLPTQHHAPSTVRDTFQKGKADTIYSGSFFSFLMERSFLKNGGRSFEI